MSPLLYRAELRRQANRTYHALSIIPLCGRSGRSAEESAHVAEKHRCFERLLHVRVGAAQELHLLRGFVGLPRENHDRDLLVTGVPLEHGADRVTVEFREEEIQDDQVRPFRLRLLDPLLPVHRRQHLVALHPEPVADHPDDHRLVVHQQDPLRRRHRSLSSRGTRSPVTDSGAASAGAGAGDCTCASSARSARPWSPWTCSTANRRGSSVPTRLSSAPSFCSNSACLVSRAASRFSAASNRAAAAENFFDRYSSTGTGAIIPPRSSTVQSAGTLNLSPLTSLVTSSSPGEAEEPAVGAVNNQVLANDTSARGISQDRVMRTSPLRAQRSTSRRGIPPPL